MSGTLQEDQILVHMVGSDLCKTIINITLCCVTSVLILIILLTATYVRRHKGKALLHFHDKNGYVNSQQYYFIAYCLSCPTLKLKSLFKLWPSTRLMNKIICLYFNASFHTSGQA
jgi:hypothetical protein